MANWSQLPHDLLALIAKRVKVIEDFSAFGAVCTSWRSAATKDNFDYLSPQVPLLMLAEKDDDDVREFYSLSKQKIARRFSLPEARRKRCFSSHGWLCITDAEDTGEVYLLNPLCGTKIQLPCLTEDTPPGVDPSVTAYYQIFRAILSANPSLTSDYVLMISFFSYTDCLVFWRPGDMTWTFIDHKKLGFDKWGGYIDVSFCNGQFYALTKRAQVWAFDIPRSSHQSILKPHLVASLEDDRFRVDKIHIYSVELSGALLIIIRSSEYENHPNGGFKTTGFKILELDVVTGKANEIKILGDGAIFLGINGAFFIEISKSSAIKPNYIYFTDDWTQEFESLEGGGGRDMGAYNLEDGKIESFYFGTSLSPICPPIWVTPSL